MLKSIALAAFLFAGCVGSGTYSGTATVEAAPALVEVSPGVQVVEDYDYPVFYSDGAYYRYDGGIWYRSSHYRDGWSRTYDVPARVRSIDRPGAYAHYRRNNANVTTFNRERDHREFDQRTTPAPQPIIRDHRDENTPPVIRHDDRRDDRERERVPVTVQPQPTPQPTPLPQGPREDHPRQERPQPAHDEHRGRDDRKDDRDRDRKDDKDKHHRD